MYCTVIWVCIYYWQFSWWLLVVFRLLRSNSLLMRLISSSSAWLLLQNRWWFFLISLFLLLHNFIQSTHIINIPLNEIIRECLPHQTTNLTILCSLYIPLTWRNNQLFIMILWNLLKSSVSQCWWFLSIKHFTKLSIFRRLHILL
jgi:hypothetical protein